VATRWVLDTNLYIGASHDREARRALDAFHDVHFGRTDLAATVWLELQVGVRGREMQVQLDDLIDTFAERDAVLAPSAQAFQQAGRVLGALAVDEGLELDEVRPSFHHDVLLACTVREHGRTLITDNARDFMRVQRHLRGFRFVTPFPS
jgi:predicted nucleic acid-binding protein